MNSRSLICLLLGASAVTHAEPRPTAGDTGGIGVLQTPSARMAPAGEFAFHVGHVSPYRRYAITLTPFDWLEGTFRYTDIKDLDYGPESLSGDQTYKDKAFDVKVRLWRESHWLPDVALGGRDIGGTGLFAGEYVVANKRFYDFDLSLGMGWGYLGQRGDFDNPFSVLGDKYETRPNGGTRTGEFSGNSYFRGPVALFGGIQWQTPWDPLTLKLEYEGNDYSNEPATRVIEQDSPINVGMVYKLNDIFDLHLGWERGNTGMLGLTFHTNFVNRTPPAKINDPKPLPVATQRPATVAQPRDWNAVAQQLRNNAGYEVTRIAERQRELVVYGEQNRYLYRPQALGRAARILDANASSDTDWFTVVDSQRGVAVQEDSLNREAFREAVHHGDELETLRRSVSQTTPSPRRETTLYTAEPERLTYGVSPNYTQNVGGPDGFILYQISAKANAEYRFRPDLWWSSSLSVALLDNFDKFEYDAPSNLPRVRTYLREYMTSSDVTMPTFQLNKTMRLDRDWYAMGYGGYLESMYAGVGGEVLYRPMGERWAVGGNLNYVKQRGFKQDFSLRDYDVVTGHLTGYYRWPWEDIVSAVSVGRYLARDIGVTFDVSREFKSGTRFGAYATFTDVSAEEYGEGSFTKGFYVSFPFDELLTTSTTRRANFSFTPLTRDGGAMLGRSYTLYDITDDRNHDLFHNNFEKILE